MMRTEIAVVGGGQAGLAAAIEARRCGARVTLIDENRRPGGQLFKQIHKFFGSREHHAGMRGYSIGQQLLQDCQKAEVRVVLGTVVWGIFEGNHLGVANESGSSIMKADKIILATGASENPLAFPGWTLPGVLGLAGATALFKEHMMVAGRRTIVAGNGPLLFFVASEVLRLGGKVSAVIS